MAPILRLCELRAGRQKSAELVFPGWTKERSRSLRRQALGEGSGGALSDASQGRNLQTPDVSSRPSRHMCVARSPPGPPGEVYPSPCLDIVTCGPSWAR